MLKQIVRRSGSAGGHTMSDGGQIPIDAEKNTDWQGAEERLLTRFLKKLKYKEIKKKPSGNQWLQEMKSRS